MSTGTESIGYIKRNELLPALCRSKFTVASRGFPATVRLSCE